MLQNIGKMLQTTIIILELSSKCSSSSLCVIQAKRMKGKQIWTKKQKIIDSGWLTTGPIKGALKAFHEKSLHCLKLSSLNFKTTFKQNLTCNFLPADFRDQ